VVDLRLWKIWKSVGVTILNIWKSKINVPNHQPATYISTWSDLSFSVSVSVSDVSFVPRLHMGFMGHGHPEDSLHWLSSYGDLTIPMHPLVFLKRLLRQITFLGKSLPWEFQDPKLELPTKYKARNSHRNHIIYKSTGPFSIALWVTEVTEG
jgi:hypothetical protein